VAVGVLIRPVLVWPFTTPPPPPPFRRAAKRQRMADKPVKVVQ